IYQNRHCLVWKVSQTIRSGFILTSGNFGKKEKLMNTTMKKTLAGILFVLVFAIYGTAAFAATGILKTPYLIYPGVNTTMEVLWQDNDTETTNVLSWGTDPTYT